MCSMLITLEKLYFYTLILFYYKITLYSNVEVS